MPRADADRRVPIVDQVVDLVSGDDAQAEVRRRFTRRYLQRQPADLLAAAELNALLAESDGLLEFAATRGKSQILLRVFNPKQDRDGYGASGTVVEAVTEDRPFLVDSVSAAFNRRGIGVNRVAHPVVGFVRNDKGEIIDLVPTREAETLESVQHHELDRELDEEERTELEEVLGRTLRDVDRAVRDFVPMRRAVRHMVAYAEDARGIVPDEEIDEAIEFLEWLLDDNFVFLGYREYGIADGPRGREVFAKPRTGLGILSSHDDSRYSKPIPVADLEPELISRFEGKQLLVITKTNRHSRVHRDARMDYVSVRLYDEEGNTSGEARMLGLLTSKAYMAEAATIPVLKRKLERVLEAEDLIEGSHDYKLLIQIFESFPKDDLFTASDDELRASLVGLLHQEDEERVRLFIRRDPLRRSVSVLVVVPRDRFDAELRQKLQALFLEQLGGTAVDYRLSLDETGDARIHFTVWREGFNDLETDFEALEREVLALTRTWSDQVRDALYPQVGDQEADRLVRQWSHRFPSYYTNSTELALATADIQALDFLEHDGRSLHVAAHNEEESEEKLTRVAVYNKGEKLPLSKMMPMLEDLGLQVVEEVPTRIKGDEEILIHDFGVLDSGGRPLDLERCGDRLCAAVAAGLRGEAESDSLHRLVVATSLTHEDIAILRAYRTYWRLVTGAFSIRYMDDAFVANPTIAENLIALFEARFSPQADTAAEAAVRAAIRHDLEAVTSLDEDRILRGFQGLIDATIRTNAYSEHREVLVLKLRSARVPEMPEPYPLYEVFVYGRDVEGVHLRGGAVSRGGIRWSIRREDYRTEVLGLMKAQMTKNAIIVPEGAKGGFIVRRRLAPTPDELTLAYEVFIGGLLDVTDNLVAGEVIHPVGVRIHDGGDPYLVVAADRGTARLSDNANALSIERGYWLRDAFASGGRTGYDHKALAITARGAWESVRRHFLDIGRRPNGDATTVIGIGDMSGDVFGNGMLLSESIKLIAAFDHRDIFIDPNPDPTRSYAERKRLFEQPRSSWQDYDREALSAGGAIYSRAAKRITLSDEAIEALDTDAREMTPSELIRAVLRAPADLLWNGGLGTYVKASSETHAEAQDRASDVVRIDATELRCTVVGEGGNLGFTQAARIEFDRLGGQIFTDFIDNSGGVHSSDREVNLKILLGLAMERGELDPAERDDLIMSVAPNVVAAVVYENYLQAQILSQEYARSAERIDPYEDLMHDLEEDDLLDRAIEDLPSTEDMIERSREGRGMARPELAVLLAYAKRNLTAAILASDLPDWDRFDSDLVEYFPGPVAVRFGYLVVDHPLRRELVATIVANQVIDSEGITFVSRLQAETGASPADVVRAYRMARVVTGAQDRWATIESLDGAVDAPTQRTLLEGVDGLVESATRWYLARTKAGRVPDNVADWAADFAELAAEISDIGPVDWREERNAGVRELVEEGVPEDLARRHVYEIELVHGPDIIDVAKMYDRPVLDVARIFFRAGQSFGIDWLEDQVALLPARTRWERWSVQALEDDLLLVRRQLAERILSEGTGRTADEAVDLFLLAHANDEGRLVRFMRLLARDGVTDTASVIVAVRRIRSLIG